MGHSQAEKAKSRQRILDAAALQIKEFGLEGVSIGELMKSAKLTHGGFYGHFSTRSDLIAAALDKALSDGAEWAISSGNAKGPRRLKSYLNSYLSKAHRDDPRSGCAISALAGDVARADLNTRKIMTAHFAKHVDILSGIVSDDASTESAISVLCTIVGAITLSRAISDDEAADKVLLAARKMILDYAQSRSPS